MFHYLGNERLQLYFFSPNVCGAFLTMTILLSIGFFWLLRERKESVWKVAAYCILPLIVVQLAMLAWTYSRGGYIACMIALLVVGILSRKRWNWLFPILLTVMILLTGSGASRLKSIGDITEGSIWNRLLLWEGGTGIIAKYWANGVRDLNEVGALYTRWYQPLSLDEGYLTLINDYLTVAAMFGIFALFFLLALLLFLLQLGFIISWKNRNLFLLCLCTAVSGYMIAAFFSTCCRFPSVVVPLGGLVVLITVIIVLNIRLKRFQWRHWMIWPAPVLALLTCMAILSYGTWVNSRLAYAWKYHFTAQGSKLLSVVPRSAPFNGYHVFLPIPSVNDSVRAYLRPLASAGFKATAIETEAGFGELDKLSETIHSLTITQNESRNILLGGGAEQAIQVLALAGRLSPQMIHATATLDAPAEWPFEELSPVRNIMRCRMPLLLFFHKDAEQENARLLKFAEELKVSGKLIAPTSDSGMASGEQIAFELLKFMKEIDGDEK